MILFISEVGCSCRKFAVGIRFLRDANILFDDSFSVDRGFDRVREFEVAG